MIFNTIVSGGGSGNGGVLTVTAPSGVTAIISNDTLGKRYERIVSSSGTAIFDGLASGTWELYISDGERVSKTSSITVDTDYDVMLSFFKATINITYPAGSTCTCTHVATGLKISAPDDTGIWELTVPYNGEWEITVTNGVDTTYQIVEINSEGQSLNIGTSSLVPTEYQKLEYIESSGTQYIDAGLITISPDVLFESEIKFSMLGGGYTSLFSVYSPWDNQGDVVLNVNNLQVVFNYFGSNAQGSTIKTGETHKARLVGDTKASMYLNDAVTGSVGTAITNSNSFSSYLSIFASKYMTNSSIEVSRNAVARIYYLKISYDGSLIRDFVPCYRRSDGAAGMYDRVTKTFFANSGTGDFIKGPEITQ